MRTRYIVVSCVFLAVAAFAVSVAAGAGAPETGQGRTLLVGCDGVDATVFESDAPLHVVDEPKPAVLFDQSKLPSSYETCYVEFWESEHLKISRPYDEASFPPNIAPPQFTWEDRRDNLWMLVLKPDGWEKPLRVITSEKKWRPDFATWEQVKKGAAGGSVELEIRGCIVEDAKRVGAEVYVDSARFRISQYPADPVIVYRLVSPLFHAFKTPDIFAQNISGYRQQVMYPGAGIYCANCHSFPASPVTTEENLNLGIAIRQRLGGERYAILGLYNFFESKGVGINVNTFFMSWNPDGKYLAVCAGYDTYSKPLITLEAQEFLVRQANINIVSQDGRENRQLPGAATKEYMETFPAWSPDGETILFTRAREIGDNWHPIKFDIYQVPYNKGEGGEAVPHPAAAQNGMSNYFPRFSPDGKWMVWTKAEWSSLVSPTGDLWMTSAAPGGESRPLECNDKYSMDSHHSWSSNSRWLLFASKRDDGIFARVYLTEIDDEGHASPPIRLPALDDDSMMCYNVPEFMKYDMPFDVEDILAKTTAIK